MKKTFDTGPVRYVLCRLVAKKRWGIYDLELHRHAPFSETALAQRCLLQLRAGDRTEGAFSWTPAEQIQGELEFL